MEQIKLSELICPVYAELKTHLFKNDVYRLEIKGGRFSAKGDTVYTLISILLATSQEPCEGRVFIPLQKNIVSGVQEQIIKVLNRMGLRAQVNRSTHTITFENQSRIIIGGLYASGGVSNELENGADTSLSGGIRFVVFDELNVLRNYDIITKIEGTFARHKHIQFIEISNPPSNQKHPLAERYKNNANSNNCFNLKTTIYDIPKEWTTTAQWALINDWENNDNIKYRHNILGEMVGQDGLLINYEDLKFITVDELEQLKFKKTIAVIDTKSTGADNYVCAVIGITNLNQFVLRDVIYTDEVLTEKLMIVTANMCNYYGVANTFIEINKDYSIYLFLKNRINNRVHKFTTTMNKHQKILTYSEDIKSIIYVDAEEVEYKKAVESITLYDVDEKENKQIHDDMIDTLAMFFKLVVENKNKLGLTWIS